MTPVPSLGVAGLALIFLIGALRPINLGVLALVLTFVIGTFVVHEAPREMYSGFPVDLFVLLTGVTYLFGVAVKNGTVDWIVEASVRRAQGRRALVPWIVFALAAAPAMAGALGSTGVALLASTRNARSRAVRNRSPPDGTDGGARRRSREFSPLNVLGAIVHQAVTSRGLEMSVWTLFAGNLIANLAVGVVLVIIFRNRRPFIGAVSAASPAHATTMETTRPSLAIDQICTIAALVAVAVIALGFGLSIGFLAFGAAAILQLAFPKSSEGAERLVAWGVVLLVCGVVTYVGALQRYGTITAVGQSIASLGSPLVVALLLCGVGAVTSAFASSAGILGAMIPLAAPFMAQGLVGTTGFVTALALSATLVDATPFSTVGALAVANASDTERRHVYNGMLAWGASMVVIAPIVTWLVFVLPGRRATGGRSPPRTPHRLRQQEAAGLNLACARSIECRAAGAA